MRLLRDLSLKARLTLLYVGLFSALLMVLAAGFYLETRHFLIAETASDLQAQIETAVGRRHGGMPLPPPPPAPPGAPSGRPSPSVASQGDLASLVRAVVERGDSAVVLDASGKALASAGEGAGLAKAWEPCTPKLVPNRATTCLVRLSGERYLVGAMPLGDGGDVLLVGRSLRPVEQVLLRQQLMLGVGVALLLLFGTLLGFWLTSSALAPLDDMVETCNRIAAGDLSQRVNLPRRNDEIGRLAAAFDHMVDRVEATMEAQQRFVASAAHELRTPLAALQGSMDVLLRDALDDPPTARRLVQGMYREITRLFRLCDQLLGLSRAHLAESVHRRPVDLSSFFHEFMMQAGFLAQERHLSLQEGDPVTIPVDPDALKRILFNLVDNAVQHTAEGGEIVVGWRESPGGVEIFVKDNGEGIRPEDLPHVFEPFYRGDRSRSRRWGGAGLGLALVKALVEAHGGRVGVSSTPGKGATFTIWLPGE